MASLENKTKNKMISENLSIADSFLGRGLGLMGRKSLAEGHGLWLIPGNSIHTCFMKFPIDCIFVDRELKVQALKSNIQPWKFLWPIWSARSVFEFPAGTIQKQGIEKGDLLYVGR